MKVIGYLTLDPNGDRPYFSSQPPRKELKQARPDVRVYSFELDVPDEVAIDGMIAAIPREA